MEMHYFSSVCLFMDTVTRRYHRPTPFNVGYVFVKLNHYMTVINFYSYWTQLGLSHGHQYGCYTVCALYKPILTLKNLGLGNCYSWSHFISSCLSIVPPPPISKGNPKKDYHRHSKTTEIWRMDQFWFFNCIWETFWWVIRRVQVSYKKCATVL